MQFLYEAAKPLIDSSDSPEAAFETSKKFAALKENPPFPFRVAFFPQDEGSMRTAFRGLGIYRPTIKTDQGPAGNVSYFDINQSRTSRLEGRVAREKGVALVEAFLEQKLRSDCPPEAERHIRELIQQAKENYQVGNYKATDDAIRNIRALGAVHGIETTRHAGVGRGEFFFFRPVETEPPLAIGSDLLDRIAVKINYLTEQLDHLALLTKHFVKQGANLQEAIDLARRLKNVRFADEDHKGHLYFQPDVLIRNDGTFDIERMNMPDLGMFLMNIDNQQEQNPILAKIQMINEDIKNQTLDVIAEHVADHVTLVTRDEVLNNSEDTLEQLELKTMSEGLKARAREVTIAPLSAVDNLSQDSSVLLLNVDVYQETFNSLLYRVARGELQCYPDPFVKLFEQESTTFLRIRVEGQTFEKFLALIAPSAMDKPEGVLAKYKAIDKALTRCGVEEDIIYFRITGVDGTIPAFRYDVKSFSEVYKAVIAARRQGIEVDSIIAMPVEFKPKDAVLYGKDGPRLSVFRFMFVRK